MIRGLFVALVAAAMCVGSAFAQDPQSFEPQADPNKPIDIASADAAAIEAARLAEPERIAGVRTYSELIANYPGTAFSQIGRSVGRLRAERPIDIFGEVPRSAYCTAWLVDRSRILTARHCVEGPVGAVPTGNMLVEFGFGWSRATSRDYRLGPIIAADEILDFALVQLETPLGQPLPGDVHGIIRLAAALPTERPLFVVHHPFGFAQLLIKDNTCRRYDVDEGEDWQFFHRCDTRLASSGAPVLIYGGGRTPGSARADAPLAVALHIAGQVLLNDNSVNLATSTAAIVAATPELGRLACQRNPDSSWSCPSLSRPDRNVRTYQFDQGWGIVRFEPDGFSGFLPPQEFTDFGSRVRGDLPPTGYFVLRVTGDASIDEVPPVVTGAENREKARQSIAFWRASNMITMLMSGGHLPLAFPTLSSPPTTPARWYHLDVQIRQDSEAGSSRTVEVFVE